MKRLYTRDASKEDLKELFRLLTPILLGHDSEDGEAKQRRAVMESFGWHRNDWQKLVKGEYNLDTYRQRIKDILRKVKRTPYRKKDGFLTLTFSNPRLSTILRRWKEKHAGNIRYCRYFYAETHRQGPDNNTTTEGKLRHALLALNFQNNECCFYIFKSKQERESELFRQGKPSADRDLLKDLKENIDEWVEARYRGNIVKTKNQLYLATNHRVKSKNSRDDVASHYGLSIFRISSKKSWPDHRFTVGNFAGIGPSSGVCVVEKCQSVLPYDDIFNSRVHSTVRHLLSGKTHAYTEQKHLYSPVEHEGLLKRLRPFARYYAGYILISRERRQGVSEILFQIQEDGGINIEMANGRKLTGQVFHITNLARDYRLQNQEQTTTAISCWINYNYKYDYYKVFMSLEVPSTPLEHDADKAPHLKGIYSGLTQRDDYPQSGRILLCPVDDPDEVKIRILPSTEWSQLTDLAVAQSYLLSFFGGFEDDFSDNPYRMNPLLMERVLYSKIHAPTRHKSNKYDGTYLLYYPSSNGDARNVYQRILQIDSSSSQAVWYDYYEDSFTEKYVGAAVVIGKCLSIRFNEIVRVHGQNKPPESQAADRLLVFYIGGMAEGLNIGEDLDGKIHRQNREEKPVMTRAIIERLPDVSLEKLLTEKMQVFTENDLNDKLHPVAKIKKLLP